MAALTKWFPPDVKPVRSGWYETKGEYFVKEPAMAWWNGKDWYWAALDMEKPTLGFLCLDGHRHWRGLKAPEK